MTPLLPVAVAYMVGILLWGAAGEVYWVVAILIAAVILLCLRRTYPAILSLCAVAGFFVAALHEPGELADGCLGHTFGWSGTVEEHREYEGAQMLIVRVDSCEGEPCRSLRVKMLVPSLFPMTDETDRVAFTALLQPLISDTDLPDERDYNAALARMGVKAATVVDPDSIHRVTPEPGLMNVVRRMRRDVQRLIACAPLESGTGSFLTAALTGDRTWLSADTREMFSSAGIAHVLALSGLHVGILILILTILLFPLSHFAGGRYGRMIVTVVMLWVFAVLTGLSPSVVRAVIMATLFMECTVLQRVWSPLNALAAAAILILTFSPRQIYSPGFILTFLAVLAIIVFAARLNPFDHRRPWLNAIGGYVSVSISAMLGTGMVCAYSFHIFPAGFLIANIVVSLLLPFLLGGGVVLLMFNAVGIRAAWLGTAVDFIMRCIDGVAGCITELPGAVWRGLWVPEWAVAFYFVSLILFGLWLYRRRAVMLYAMCAVAAAGLVLMFAVGDSTPRHEMYITRSAAETTVLIREGDSLYVHTTAPKGRADDVIAHVSSRHGGYMMRRGIDGMTPMTDGMRSTHVARRGNVVAACGRSFVFVSREGHAHTYGFTPDYVVVCRGFRGDICALARVTGADSILLSRDLDLRRHDRYERELTRDSIPHRSLRSASFHLVGE